MASALSFLEKQEEEDNKLNERLIDCNSQSKYGHSRLGSDFSGRQRCSLADLNNKYFGNDSAATLKSDSKRKTME